MRLFQDLFNKNKASALETTVKSSDVIETVEAVPDDSYLRRFLFKAGITTSAILAAMGLYNAADAQTTNSNGNSKEDTSWYEDIKRSFNSRFRSNDNDKTKVDSHDNNKVKNNGNIYRFLSPDFNFKIIRGNQYNSSDGTQNIGNSSVSIPSSGTRGSAGNPCPPKRKAGILVGLFGDNDQLYNICTGTDIAPTVDNRDGKVNEIFTYNPNDGAKYEHRVTGNSLAIDPNSSMLYTTGQTGTSKYTLVRTDRNGKRSSAHIDVHVVDCEPEVVYREGPTKTIVIEKEVAPKTEPKDVKEPEKKDRYDPKTPKDINLKGGIGAFATTLNGTQGVGLEAYMIIPTGDNFSFQLGAKVSSGIRSFSDTEVSEEEKGSAEYKDIVVSNQNGQRVGAYLLANIDARPFHLNLGGGIDKNIMNTQQQYMFLFQFNDDFSKQEFESSGKVDFNEIYLTGGITLDLFRTGNMTTSLFGYAQVPVKWMVNADFPASLEGGENTNDNIDNYGSANDFGQIPTNYAMENLDKLISYGAGVRFTFGKDSRSSQKDLENRMYENNLANHPAFKNEEKPAELLEETNAAYEAEENAKARGEGTYVAQPLEFQTKELARGNIDSDAMKFHVSKYMSPEDQLEFVTDLQSRIMNRMNERFLEDGNLSKAESNTLKEMNQHYANQRKFYQSLVETQFQNQNNQVNR